MEEQLKANKRLISRAIREMDRERAQLERDQKRLEMEIRKLAKEQQMGAVKIAAKDLVRTRQHVAKFYQMRSTLQGLALKMQTMKTSHEMTQSMAKMSKAMKAMNKQMNLPKMQAMMIEFQREEAKMEMTQEMVGDVIDDAMDDPTSIDNEDAIVKQVLDEIGVDLSGKLQAAPEGTPALKQAAIPVAAGNAQEDDAEMNSLEARLENLRKEG